MEVSKQQLLINAYSSLLRACKVRNKKDFAEQINWNYTSLSSAFGGRESFLTDGLFRAIRTTFVSFDNEMNYIDTQYQDRVDRLINAIDRLVEMNDKLFNLIQHDYERKRTYCDIEQTGKDD